MDPVEMVKSAVDPVGMVKVGLAAVVILCKNIYATRPKVHKERVTRLKSRLSVLEQQLQLVEGSASSHVQQTVSSLEEVLKDMLKLLRSLEDDKWIKRVFKNICNMDGDFEELNKRLSQESLALVLSLNINASVVQQTFSTERRRREDESDRAADMKLLEEMRETLFEVKKDTEQIIEMMQENKKSGSSSTPASPVEIKVEVTHNHNQSSPPPPPPPYPGFTPAPPQGPMYPHQQPVQMAPQPAPMQNVQTQQPQVVICSGDLGNVPTMTTCPHCKQKTQTRVVYHSGTFAWLICGLSTLFGLVCGCCVIPFFVDSCKDAHHFCGSCNANLGIHKRL